MATLSSSFVDLIDLYKRQDPNGDIAVVIEMLKQQMPILDDAMAEECNMGPVHRHTIRTGLPTVGWGQLYQGVTQSKTRTQQVDDTTGFVEALSTIDKRLLDISKNKAAVRMSEAAGFIEALGQEVSRGIFYHDTTTNPERIKGLSARYSSISTGQTALNTISAGGAGSDNTSIWFITWGDNQTKLIYPEGTQAGLKREDKGEQRVLDSSGNPYYVEEELFRWHLGVAVKDWRYNARICNISLAAVQAGTVDLYKFMRKAYYKLQSRRVPGGKQAIYLNRDMLEALDALATNKGSTDNFVRLSRDEIEGKEILTYRGIPLRETDALLNTESVVS